jgi:hypothetical protein
MLLDKYLPDYDFTEMHSIRIRAAPETVFRALNEVSLDEISFIVRLLIFLRELPEKVVGRKDPPLSNRGSMLAGMYKSGFTLLSEQPPHELVFGCTVHGNIGRVWQKSSGLNVSMKNAEDFLAFKNPDYLRVVANFLVKDSGNPGTVIVSTESRTMGLSPQAKHNFAPYWRIIRPWSGLIRRLLLTAIKRRSERLQAVPVSINYPHQAHN